MTLFSRDSNTIYAHVLLTKTLLVSNDPDDVIQMFIELRAALNAQDPVLPISDAWPLTLRSNTGQGVDNILLTFTDGACVAAYRYMAGLPLGEYRIDEADFATVTLAGVAYRVKLAAPVSFTITRQLDAM